jgi:predicted DNA-binding transcriptional regulator YafY
MTPPNWDGDRAVQLDYTNWKGERRWRRVLPQSLWYGTTSYHPTPQWFIRAVDLEKNAVRDFAVKDLHGVTGT